MMADWRSLKLTSSSSGEQSGSSIRTYQNTLFDPSEPLELYDVKAYDRNSAAALGPPTWTFQRDALSVAPAPRSVSTMTLNALPATVLAAPGAEPALTQHALPLSIRRDAIGMKNSLLSTPDTLKVCGDPLKTRSESFTLPRVGSVLTDEEEPEAPKVSIHDSRERDLGPLAWLPSPKLGEAVSNTSSRSNRAAAGSFRQPIHHQQSITKANRQSIAASLMAYFQKYQTSREAWLQAPEVPDALEIIGPVNGEQATELAAPVKIELDKPWPSKREYLRQQYTLMREDTVSTLREAVEDQKRHFDQTEEESHKKVRIYERVYISGLKVAAAGLAHRLDFSLGRANKRIAWASSKRLKVGTMVALTPVADRFRKICIVAVVAGRALSALESETPSIEVFFGDPDSMEIDPQVEYLMVESSEGYFEACRHTLKALQHMLSERFPLAEHIVGLKEDVSNPEWLAKDPYLDINAALADDKEPLRPDVLAKWPKVRHSHSLPSILDEPKQERPDALPVTHLDESQFEALRRILTKRLAIVQGPPGTGKTYVSVIALKILLQNRGFGSPPIIVTAQTNHALDQLLRHVSSFAPNFIRLGGQSKDTDIIQPRTLFKVKEDDARTHADLRRMLASLRRSNKGTLREMEELLAPLTSDGPLNPKVFLEHKLISYEQYQSILETDESWVGEVAKDDSLAIIIWGEGSIQPFERMPSRARNVSDLAPENEDDDERLDGYFETSPPDDGRDILHGHPYFYGGGYASTINYPNPGPRARMLLENTKDLYDIPRRSRGLVYAWLSAQVKLTIRDRIRTLAKALKKKDEDMKFVKMQLDAAYLNEVPIIGVTTTGLSKYRAMLNSLKPQIVLIEEAAETQEAYVTAACFESLEQLILIGDHQQLQAHCQNDAMMGYNLHISMFERLIEHNDVEFQQLSMQRRMLPEMRKTINVIYPNLVDHPSVYGRPDIPGMGGRNTWWMTHSTQESVDEQFSWANQEEAEMVAQFYRYLVVNGTPSSDITVLTFYNGQRRAIVSSIKRLFVYILPNSLRVHTVDSYQGEENEIVILSLVRNNEHGQIGFLAVRNRVCVAMSRARRGFYVFGNAQLLWQRSLMWGHMINQYHSDSDRKNSRLGKHLPLVCQKHGRILRITNSMEWTNNCGGCSIPCNKLLPCRHVCRLLCHPQPHEELGCTEDCGNILPCGHQCERVCGEEPCECKECREATYSRRTAHKSSRKQRTELKVRELYKHSSGPPPLIDFSERDEEPLVKFYEPKEPERDWPYHSPRMGLQDEGFESCLPMYPALAQGLDETTSLNCPEPTIARATASTEIGEEDEDKISRVESINKIVDPSGQALSFVGTPTLGLQSNLPLSIRDSKTQRLPSEHESAVTRDRAVQAYKQFAQDNVREAQQQWTEHSLETEKRKQILNARILREPPNVLLSDLTDRAKQPSPIASTEGPHHRNKPDRNWLMESVSHRKGSKLVRTDFLKYGNPTIEAEEASSLQTSREFATDERSATSDQNKDDDSKRTAKPDFVEDLIDLSGF